MVTVRRVVRRAAPTPAPAPAQPRTWKCEHCHGTLHAGRGQTPAAVAAVHHDTCPAVLRVRTR